MGKSDYYARVPKDPIKNLEYRKKILQAGFASPSAQREIWSMCAQDILFYVNTFLFVYEPRDGKILPWITWGFQDEALLDMDACIGHNDLVVEKSRDMGASWMCIEVCEHRWHFKSYESFLFVSRNEKYVDEGGNPKSMFWKLDFLLKHQPSWLLPKFTRQRMKLLNEDNNCTIDGESTTGDVAAGDRRTAIILDEAARFEDGYKIMASTRDATKCRIFNSTPQGAHGAFYDTVKEAERTDSAIKKITLHWSRHPEKAKGIWTDENKKGRFKFRSPWYDLQCKRAIHPVEIAQELDIDYGGSNYGFFESGALDRYISTYARDPFVTGTLSFDRDSLEPNKFINVSQAGEWKLWIFPSPEGRLSDESGSYVIGCDIAGGSGGSTASQSALSVVNRDTREKVAEFTSSTIDPKEFGRLAVAACRWFKGRDRAQGGAYLIWEDNGFGATFRSAVLEANYDHIYMRHSETIKSKPTDKPGFYSSPESKNKILADYRDAICNEKMINRSRKALDECKEYVYITAAREVTHSRAVRNINPSETGKNHGDIVIADALCWHALQAEGPLAMPEEAAPAIPVGSLAWRRQQWQEQESSTNLWSKGGRIRV